MNYFLQSETTIRISWKCLCVSSASKLNTLFFYKNNFTRTSRLRFNYNLKNIFMLKFVLVLKVRYWDSVSRTLTLNRQGGRGHTGLWCDTSPCRGLCHCLMPDYACNDNGNDQSLAKFWISSSKIDCVYLFMAD